MNWKNRLNKIVVGKSIYIKPYTSYYYKKDLSTKDNDYGGGNRIIKLIEGDFVQLEGDTIAWFLLEDLY